MKRLSLTVALCLSLSAIADSERAVIELRAQARTSHGQIRLGEVADIRTADAALRQRLADVTIASAPRPGASRTLTRDDIALMTRQAAGDVALAMAGAAAVKVERPASDYSGKQLVETARAFLLAHLQQTRPDLKRIEVTPVTVLPDFRGPAGEWRAVPRLIQSAAIGKRMGVWLDVDVNGSTYRSIPLWFSVHAYRPAVIAKRSFHAKEIVAADGLAIEERDVAGVQGMPIEATPPAGLRARRSIARGGVVTNADLESMPTVLARQEVDVRVIVGPIAIDTKAVAEEEGDVGETIRVRNPRSTESYLAQVIGDKKVLVKE